MSVFKKSEGGRIAAKAIMALVAVAMAALLLWGVSDVAKRSGEENLAVMEDNIRKAAIQCYALEGFYPLDFSYLRDNYGISVDEDRYAVHYEGFASNILPSITVVPK